MVEWSAFNKAKLLVEQMEENELSLTQVGKRVGVTSHGAGQWVRGYYAFGQARENSDYINEVDERSYPFFQELFGKTSAPVREWMEWDEETSRLSIRPAPGTNRSLAIVRHLLFPGPRAKGIAESQLW